MSNRPKVSDGKIAEIVLKVDVMFGFLQYVDEGYEQNCECHREIVDGYWHRRFPDEGKKLREDIGDFVQAKTVIWLFFPALAISRDAMEDSLINHFGPLGTKDWHPQVKDREGKKVTDWSFALRIMRNAVAHILDSKDRTLEQSAINNEMYIDFDQWLFRTRDGSVQFDGPNPIVQFFHHLRRLARSLAGELLKE